jgi:hypothetical protein
LGANQSLQLVALPFALLAGYRHKPELQFVRRLIETLDLLTL